MVEVPGVPNRPCQLRTQGVLTLMLGWSVPLSRDCTSAWLFLKPVPLASFLLLVKALTQARNFVLFLDYRPAPHTQQPRAVFLPLFSSPSCRLLVPRA